VIADRRYVIAKEIVENWLEKHGYRCCHQTSVKLSNQVLFSKQEQETATRTPNKNKNKKQQQETATRTRNKDKSKKLSSYHNLSMDQVYSRNKNKNKTGNWIASSDSMRKEAWNCCRSSKGELQQWQICRRFQVLRACRRSSTWILLSLCVCVCVCVCFLERFCQCSLSLSLSLINNTQEKFPSSACEQNLRRLLVGQENWPLLILPG
jgi:hypothetical protein